MIIIKHNKNPGHKITGSVIGEKTLNSSLFGGTIHIGIDVPFFVVISILSRLNTQIHTSVRRQIANTT